MQAHLAAQTDEAAVLPDVHIARRELARGAQCHLLRQAAQYGRDVEANAARVMARTAGHAAPAHHL